MYNLDELDENATRNLALNPKEFLSNNFVITHSGLNLIPAATRWITASGNTTVNSKYYYRNNRVKKPMKLRYAKNHIQPEDCLRITGIGTRTTPTVYISLKKDHRFHRPNYYLIDISLSPKNGYIEVYYLPNRANQITCIALPPRFGPNIVLTDRVNGCSIYSGIIHTGHLAPQQALCHANARAFNPSKSIEYMNSLLEQYFDDNNHEIFENEIEMNKIHYRSALEQMKNSAKERKQQLARKTVTTDGNHYTTILGLRQQGVWEFFYQQYVEVISKRTGLKSLIKGKTSDKGIVEFKPIINQE